MDLKTIRLGNDIGIHWKIYIKTPGGREPYVIQDKDKILLYLMRGKEIFPIEKFDVSENEISFIFYGKDQRSTGKYFLLLEENRGAVGMRTVNSCPAFYLTSNSCGIGEGGTNPGVQIETIDLEGSTYGGERGLSAYEIAVQEGFVGTKQEWLDSLVGPKGDPFRYEDFTKEQLEGLRGPAGPQGESGNINFPKFEIDESMHLVMSTEQASNRDKFELDPETGHFYVKI